MPILIISHSLDQVFRLSDRICVLRRGKQIGVRETTKTDKNEIVSMITGLSSERRNTSGDLSSAPSDFETGAGG